MTNGEAIDKMQRYCAYQERCHEEVRSKLIALQVYGDQLEQVMSALITEDYLNEERFARSYARGKYRIKKWGRDKILRELKYRKISDYCIRKAMEEITEEGDYDEQLETLLTKYIESRKGKWAPRVLRQKAYGHGITKGYESGLVASFLEKYFAHGQ